MKQSTPKLEIKQRRCFSEEFKKAKVKDIVEKRIRVREVCQLYEVSAAAVYNWLYQYSPHHKQKSILVVQMESEATKTKELLRRIAELERNVGQKQLEVEFLNKLLELGSEELGFDLKKNFSAQLSNGIGPEKNRDDGK
jgi:transposase-like protein